MSYVDTHCHLGSRQFDGNRDEIIARMRKKGVDKAIMICCSRHDLLAADELRQSNPGFKLAVSIHPQDLEDHDESRLNELCQVVREYHPDVIGETGLDYYSHPHTKPYQQYFFHRHLEIAEEYGLPVNIHSRKAGKDTYDILKSHHVRGIMHSFSGSLEMAWLYVKLGFYISFGSSVLFEGAKKPAEVIANIPIERLLVETDAPYQSPIRDHIHEPADIVKIYEKISEIRGIGLKELEKRVEENFERLFSEP